MAKLAWHAMDTENVLKELGTHSQSGLISTEARNRLQQYGYNELKKEKKISPLFLFLRQFKNILIVILLIAIALSFLVGEKLDAAIIGAIVLFCSILGFVQEYRAERALEALKKMFSPTITVIRNGEEEEISTRELVPGDLLVLEAGDRISADARLVENYSMKCDEASLTGESVPVDKSVVSLPEKTLVADRKNMVFTGTVVSYGRGKAVVTSTGMETQFGQIAELVTQVKTEKTPLEKRSQEIGKLLGVVTLALCFLVASISIIRQAMTGDIEFEFLVTVMMFTIALAVAAVPEALAAIVTGALAIGMHQMAKRNALVRKMPVVETLGCATVICSDKTGTLTKGEMTVRKILAGGKMIDVTGSGYDPFGELKRETLIKPTEDTVLSPLLKGLALCNDADLHQKEGKWVIKGDPTEAALVVVAVKGGFEVREIRRANPRVDEIPFSSERKRMTSIHKMDSRERVAYMKGAPEVILERSTHILDERGVRKLDNVEKAQIVKANEEMAQRAFRMLGIAYRVVSEEEVITEETIEKEMIFLGLMGMMDPPREEAIEAVKVCKNVGIKPVMITGDHKLTAVAVAKEIGIYKEADTVLTGEDLEAISDEEFEKIVNQVTVYARVSPMDKLKIVKAWKKRGDIVAMTGDGVNDAPALKHADIGVAMGITGTEVTKEAADIVLSDDNFASIVKAIELGRWIYDNIKKYLTYLLRANATEVVFIAGIVLMMGPHYLPLLPAAILYINLATDGLPALALGVSPPDPDIMLRPPRHPKESVFSRDVRAFILTALIIEVPFFYGIFYYTLQDMTHARTMIFFLFIFIEIVIAMNFRSLKYSVFKLPPHKWLLIAIAWEFALIAVLIQFPAVRLVFDIQIPSVADLGVIAGVCIVVFASMEIVKIALRRKV